MGCVVRDDGPALRRLDYRVKRPGLTDSPGPCNRRLPRSVLVVRSSISVLSSVPHSM